jgi:hypothetical protein
VSDYDMAHDRTMTPAQRHLRRDGIGSAKYFSDMSNFDQ